MAKCQSFVKTIFKSWFLFSKMTVTAASSLVAAVKQTEYHHRQQQQQNNNNKNFCFKQRVSDA